MILFLSLEIADSDKMQHYSALQLRLYCLLMQKRTDSDDMQHYAAFQLGLHCLLKYLFRGFPKTEGLKQLNLRSIANVYLDVACIILKNGKYISNK